MTEPLNSVRLHFQIMQTSGWCLGHPARNMHTSG